MKFICYKSLFPFLLHDLHIFTFLLLQRLETKYNSNPSKFEHLYSIVQMEVDSKTAKGSSSCTNGLLWLTRFALLFVVNCDTL